MALPRLRRAFSTANDDEDIVAIFMDEEGLSWTAMREDASLITTLRAEKTHCEIQT